MKFKLTNDMTGGSFIGQFTLPYKDVVKIFGNPNFCPSFDDKVMVEWDIEFEDGLRASIYNWKDGKNYDPEDGLPKTKLFEWHVGGDNPKVFEYVINLVREYEGKK